MSILFIVIILAIFFLVTLAKNFNSSKLPPGPKPWPIIGNIHQLGNLPHRTLAHLSTKYGPIMSLKLGTVTTVVISSPDIAKVMFLKHDLAVSSRTVPDATRVATYDQHSTVWLPVCPKWRNLRKIMTIQLLTCQRLDASQGIRQRVVVELVEYARHCCENGLAMDIGKAVFTATLNLMSNTFFSMDLASHDSSKRHEFKDLISKLFEETSRPNVSDFFPLVKKLDLQGVKKRIQIPFDRMIGIFEQVIEERLKDEMGCKDDVLGTLLKLVKNMELSLDDVKHMLVDLFIGGTESTSNTLEWAMTELLRNPKKMARAQNELFQVIGKNGSVQETDIPKLAYIQAIVKETLRLHPPAPFLLPRKAVKDVELCGYHIPQNSQVWVNVWSTGRDPNVWSNPSSFEPERFLELDVDMSGRDFKLIPFGAGRRICPGITLAQRMMHLMLASLLHTFNWKYGGGGANEYNINVDEKFAITLQRAQPLQAIPISRQFHV